MKDLIKEYKNQITIIIGSLIIAFAVYFGMTHDYRTKVNECVAEKKWNQRKAGRFKYKDGQIEKICKNSIARYGRW